MDDLRPAPILVRSVATQGGKRAWPGFLLAAVAAILLGACAKQPLIPFSVETPPLVLLPASYAGIQDGRARFREILCAVLEARKNEVPDYRPCEKALTRIDQEGDGSGSPVDLGPSRLRLVAALVNGIGAECIMPWLKPKGTAQQHMQRYGYDLVMIPVEGLSSCARNAEMIRDAIMAMPAEDGAPRIVLLGYSKGAPDVMQALVSYPEILPRLAAFVSVAGAIGGSPLADDVDQGTAELLQLFPGAKCGPGDRGGVESLRPRTRQAWLATHKLPTELRYYSLATFPDPQRMSRVLGSSAKKLGRVDARNDSQLIFYNQIVPGSTLLGFVNADHWAVVVPFERTHPDASWMLTNENDFPREALLEAVMRYVEEDLSVPKTP